jgi:hypothetical protein
MVMFNGVEVVEGWPEQVERAQRKRTVRIDGEEVARVRFGEEEDDWGAEHGPCPDCAAAKGQFHVPSCDVEECPGCGHQWISCGCSDDVEEDELTPAGDDLPEDS